MWQLYKHSSYPQKHPRPQINALRAPYEINKLLSCVHLRRIIYLLSKVLHQSSLFDCLAMDYLILWCLLLLFLEIMRCSAATQHHQEGIPKPQAARLSAAGMWLQLVWRLRRTYINRRISHKICDLFGAFMGNRGGFTPLRRGGGHRARLCSRGRGGAGRRW